MLFMVLCLDLILAWFIMYRPGGLLQTGQFL